MVAPVILYGSSVLRKHSIDVTEEDNIAEITGMLFDTLKNAEGIGLAGPQIDFLKRVLVIDTSPLRENDTTIEKYEKAMINPVIIDINDKTELYKEGCLSIPGIYEEVKRSEKVLVRYQDILFNTIEEELDGMEARIFLHEYDHLEGILFIDKINPLKRKLLSRKLEHIKKLSAL